MLLAVFKNVQQHLPLGKRNRCWFIDLLMLIYWFGNRQITHHCPESFWRQIRPIRSSRRARRAWMKRRSHDATIVRYLVRYFRRESTRGIRCRRENRTKIAEPLRVEVNGTRREHMAACAGAKSSATFENFGDWFSRVASNGTPWNVFRNVSFLSMKSGRRNCKTTSKKRMENS